MEETFKIEMEKIASLKLQKGNEEIDSKQILLEKSIQEEKSKEAFNQLKNNVILPMESELNKIFKNTGDKFLSFSNEKATSLKDQLRTFCQIFYYPKERSQSKFGLNTSSLLFEYFPLKKEVQISSNTELRSAPLQKIKTLSLKKFDSTIIEPTISTFVSAVTK